MRTEMQISATDVQRTTALASAYARLSAATAKWFDCDGSSVNHTPTAGPGGTS